MKFCKNCGEEISTKDGENYCKECDLLIADDKTAKLKIRRKNRQLREQALRDLGLTKVKGSMGGIYWE